MRDFGVHTYHIRVIERVYEGQSGTYRREVNVAARLVGLGLKGELQAVPLVENVVTQEVQGIAVALQSFLRVFGGIAFDAFSPTPEDVYTGTKLHAQVN